MKKTKLNYTPKNLMKALKSVQEGKYKICEASRIYKIPRQTIADKITGRRPATFCRPGPQAVLGQDIETQIEDWLMNTSTHGFPFNKQALMYSVKYIIDNIPNDLRTSIPFKNNTPGKGWFNSFCRRHPRIAKEYNENKEKLKSNVTDGELRKWFAHVEKVLRNSNAWSALFNAKRVYIMDETKLYASTKLGTVLLEKGRSSKSVADEDISMFIACNVTGKFAPPMLTSKESSFSISLQECVPEGWSVRNNDSCSITCETLLAYFRDVFYPYLTARNVTFPVVAFIKGGYNCVSLPLYEFCQERSIILLCMPLHALHIIDPLDMSSFFPLDETLSTSSKYLNNHPVVCLINDLLTSSNVETFVAKKVEDCGIFPFNPDRSGSAADLDLEEDKGETSIMVAYVESKIPKKILQQFRYCRGNNLKWHGPIGYTALFEFWLNVVIDDEATLMTPSECTTAPSIAVESEYDLENFILEEEIEMKEKE